MSIKRIPINEVDLSIIYITLGQLARETGLSASGLRKYLRDDVIDGFMVDKKNQETKATRGRDIFINPENADQLRNMIKAGLIIPKIKAEKDNE